MPNNLILTQLSKTKIFLVNIQKKYIYIFKSLIKTLQKKKHF